MFMTLCSTCKDDMSWEDPVENSSTEKLTSPRKTGIRLLLHRAQKAVEYGFLRRCGPDSVERFVPPPSEPRYAALESTEAQTGVATPVSDVTCISEEPTDSVQSRSNSVPECPDFVLPGEVPVETIGSSDTTRVNITTIAEDNVEKIDKRLRWKKTRSLFRRARERLRSGAGVEESSEPLTDSTLDLEELSDGMLSGSESIPETTLPGEVLFEPAVAPGMEAGLVEKGSAEKPTEWTGRERICYCLKTAWTAVKQLFLTCVRSLRLTAE